MHPEPHITTINDVGLDNLKAMLAPLDLEVVAVAADAAIPGSFWGDSEAGLHGSRLFVRGDTPVHSALHEAGHYVCMDPQRRAGLDTNAGGDYDEENAVCYWQILASDDLPGMSRARMCDDMDAWGYTFRLGSAAAWFADDAEDAHAWLLEAGVLDPDSDTLRPVVRR